ncbi:hypothetical protein OQA88_10905 [Cercophora sp. LCS_1]
MIPEIKKTRNRAANLNDLIEQAISHGLPQSKENIGSEPVYRELVPCPKPQYTRLMELWFAYEQRFPGANPCDMETMKQFSEAIARSTRGRLDEASANPTVKSVRNKIRKFMAAWERENSTSVPRDARQYIQGALRGKIPLSFEEKTPTFLRIGNYVHTVCRRSSGKATITITCMSIPTVYKIADSEQDLVCMVGWSAGEPEIKLSFKRDLAKGKQNSRKKPKHPMPPPTAKFRAIEWEDDASNEANLLEMSAVGPRPSKAKNKSVWSQQCSDWAKWANFVGGMGLYTARKEELIKVDDVGYSLGQVMKVAGRRNPNTLVGHYLDDRYEHSRWCCPVDACAKPLEGCNSSSFSAKAMC